MKKYWGTFLALLAGSLLTACGGKGGEEITIADNGVSDYVIVYGSEATDTEVNAAAELREYLYEISGAELEIVVDSKKEQDKEIIVGKTNREGKNEFDRDELGEDGYVIKTADSKLWLVGGGDRGTLYSVYGFLEDYLGCGFYTSDVEVIPEMATITLAIQKDKQIPSFAVRGLRVSGSGGTDYSVKRRFNLTLGGRQLPDDTAGGGIDFCGGTGGHTYDIFVPADLFKSHPEYFGMDDKGNRVASYQPCLTNPDVIQLMVEGAIEWLEEYPEAEVVPVSQSDHQYYCRCDNCMELCEENGGALSAPGLMVCNEVAKAIKKDYPGVYVQFYAYEYSRSVPTKIKPEENVLIDLCTMGACFGHPIEEECDEKIYMSYMDGTGNSFMDDLEDWDEVCNENQLKIYDYCSDFSYKAVTFPNLHVMRENVRTYAENGAAWIESEGMVGTIRSPKFDDLRSYLYSKLFWDADMSETEYDMHIDNFLNAVYGEGGKYLKEYIEIAEKAATGKKGNGHINLSETPSDMYPVKLITNHKEEEIPDDLTVAMVKNYAKTDWTKYWNWYKDVQANDVISKGTELFNEALKLAKTDLQKENLRRITGQITYLRSCYYYMQITTGGKIDQMIRNFMEKNADSFTEAEKSSLPSAIAKLAKEQVDQAYYDFNYAFCEEMLSVNVSSLGHSDLTGYKSFDFKCPPYSWI